MAKHKHNYIAISILVACVVLVALIGKIAIDGKAEAEQVAKRVDARFKYYDFAFIHEHSDLPCVDTTNEEILDYYARYGVELTPTAKELLKGKYRCHD